jgi:hypothetical protein
LKGFTDPVMPNRDVETIRDLIGEKKYYDVIPPLVEKKYLKTVLQRHVCAGTLDDAKPVRNREISVLDIDSIIR